MRVIAFGRKRGAKRSEKKGEEKRERERKKGRKEGRKKEINDISERRTRGLQEVYIRTD